MCLLLRKNTQRLQFWRQGQLRGGYGVRVSVLSTACVNVIQTKTKEQKYWKEWRLLALNKPRLKYPEIPTQLWEPITLNRCNHGSSLLVSFNFFHFRIIASRPLKHNVLQDCKHNDLLTRTAHAQTHLTHNTDKHKLIWYKQTNLLLITRPFHFASVLTNDYRLTVKSLIKTESAGL